MVLANEFRITCRDVTFQSDASTWRYRVEELSGAQDLSNWVLALPGCVRVVSATPQPWEVVHPDPNAGLVGIKWETGAGFHSGEFAVTLAGNVSVGTTQVAAKGPDVAHGSIVGPRCPQQGLPGDLARLGLNGLSSTLSNFHNLRHHNRQ